MDVRKLLGTRPFVSFTIVTSDGSRYPVPTTSHGGVDPQSSRVVIWLDDGSGIMIPGLHISSIEPKELGHRIGLMKSDSPGQIALD